jgi:5-formyltetrahydrofolate cyclo-ligase
MSMPHGEVSTRNIVQDALSKGKQVFIPHIHFMRTAPSGKAVSGMDMLSLNSMLDFESLQPDRWGIPSFSDDTVPTRRNCFGGFGISATDSYPSDNEWGLDLIVMPGMAFDSGFNRLGHGKGYYDNFLGRYAKRATSDPSKRLTNPLLGKYDHIKSIRTATDRASPIFYFFIFSRTRSKGAGVIRTGYDPNGRARLADGSNNRRRWRAHDPM